MKHILRPAFGVVLAAGLSLSTAAAESTNVQCFTPAQFESGDATLTGICLRTLPAQKYGTVMLGSHRLHQLFAGVLQRPCRGGYHDAGHQGTGKQAPGCRGQRL